jgi:DNA repair exonuclease SbcCD ATPase subunit
MSDAAGDSSSKCPNCGADLDEDRTPVESRFDIANEQLREAAFKQQAARIVQLEAELTEKEAQLTRERRKLEIEKNRLDKLALQNEKLKILVRKLLKS